MVKQYIAHFYSGEGNLPPGGPQNTGGSVIYKLRASITYNPNTMKITSATRVLRTYIRWSGWEPEMEPFVVNEVSPNPVIAPNQYSASFSHSMGIKANYAPGGPVLGTLSYGTLSDSFTITLYCGFDNDVSFHVCEYFCSGTKSKRE